MPSEKRSRNEEVFVFVSKESSLTSQACPTKQGSGLCPSLSHKYPVGILGKEPKQVNFCVLGPQLFQT